jgi:iron complex outermembrane receptor protein
MEIVIGDFSDMGEGKQWGVHGETFDLSVPENLIYSWVYHLHPKKMFLDGFFYTYDDDFSTPGEIVTIEGVGYYPQAGTNFLLGATFKF